MSHLMDVYKRLPVTFERGEGVWLWDTDGNKYLDALSGIAVSGLGHAHPAVVKAIQTQAAKLIHTSNLYHIANQEKLADVYGEPRESLEIIDYRVLPEYLIRYSWAESRLDITLKLDYTLEINAFSFSPLLGPIFNK